MSFHPGFPIVFIRLLETDTFVYKLHELLAKLIKNNTQESNITV